MKILVFLIFPFMIFSCKRDKPTIPLSENDIIAFNIRMADNPQISIDFTAQITNDTIHIKIPDQWPEELIPTIVLSEKAVLQGGVKKENFSHPVYYMIAAENGDIKKYVAIRSSAGVPELNSFKINGAACSYDSTTSSYYFPVSTKTGLTHFSVQFNHNLASSISFNQKTISGSLPNDLHLKTNDSIQIIVSDIFKQKTQYQLIITGLPMVQLSGNPEIGDEYQSINCSIIDPDFDEHKGNFYITSSSAIKIRGGTSRAYPKKSYALKIKDNSGNDKDISILGLREDQNWILDAMYIDKAKMRNRLCTDLWNSMNNVPYHEKEPNAINGTRGYLAEVFINNEYRGIYTLTEKVDRKQLKVKKKTGFVFKASTWTEPVMFKEAMPYFDNNSEEWEGWESKYPEADDDRPIDWSILYNFVKFVSTSSDEDFKDSISNLVDLDNLADYLIFINAVQAEDNSAKNTFFSIYDTSISKKFFYTVWDLDATLGRTWRGEIQTAPFYFNGPNSNLLYRRLLQLNPGNFIGRIKAKWQELKNNQLALPAINTLLIHYRDQMINTKADQREKAKWGNSISDLNTERAYILSWYQQHQQKVDELINGL